jgi:hypothetical protein
MDKQRWWVRWRTRILAVIAVPLVMLLCVGGVGLVLDGLCYAGLTQRLPIYPGATVVFEEHSGLRAFGSGETLMIIETSDPIDVVRDWYGRNAGGAVRRMKQNGQEVLISLTSAQYSLVALEDNSGTQIALNGVCGG